MTYGEGRSSGDVQWLKSGKGILHEEMWDTSDGRTEQELFQIWVDSPKGEKYDGPRVECCKVDEG
eukprot:CAMPEP_0118638092 /NCGR_PEP_ID=MMETSP0785-20121206/3497_1 /TAXON_ID=91992 /ORGANISM="Bolidomonas pacifica, Strain CCMP 1866" /LENGTH=64 /DNA_ID=CAMNT_0006529313 /DNA_START=693 /DNA_END=883 /DNA_ORIENTATION=+